MQSLHLNSLPIELILIILQNLGWDDIQRVRQTCHFLRQLSKEKPVLQNLVVRYTKTIPNSAFSLEQPVSSYTTDELERIIKQHEASVRGWTLDSVNKSRAFVPLKREIQLQYPAKTFSFIEGGRWLLVVRITGSVSYYDLKCPRDQSSVSRPRTLIPDLVEKRPWTMVLVASHRDCTQPFLTFHFAIYTRTWLGFVSEQIQIWRVCLEVDEGTGTGIGLMAHHVVTLTLGFDLTPNAITLCGKYVAWSFQLENHFNITVVDWTEAVELVEKDKVANKTIPFNRVTHRKIVHHGSEGHAFRLLPGDFLLLACSPEIKLYDLHEVPCILPGSSITIGGLITESTPPTWETIIRGLICGSLSTPFLCPNTNTVRCVAYSRHTVHGLIVPFTYARYSTLSAKPEIISDPGLTTPRVVKLGEYYLNTELRGFSSGYHTAVVHTFDPQTIILRYRWPDESGCETQSQAQETSVNSHRLEGVNPPPRRHKEVAITCKNWSPFTPVMDEGSGRVIYSAQSGTQLVIVDFSR